MIVANINHLIIVLIKESNQGEEEPLSEYITYTLLVCLVTFGIWYIFQKRELKRFFQQLELENKEIRAIQKEK